MCGKGKVEHRRVVTGSARQWSCYAVWHNAVVKYGKAEQGKGTAMNRIAQSRYNFNLKGLENMNDTITISREHYRKVATDLIDKRFEDLVELGGKAQMIHTILTLTFAAEIERELFKEDNDD